MALKQPRNTNIDLLRGWLILLVIVGHIVLGSVHENLMRYVIYAFHMPLFIGLSGYLINAQKLTSTTLMSVFSRYWRRVLLPFALAFIVFTGVLVIHAWQEERISQGLLLSYFLTPYYHLWFIPTLVLWVVSSWAALKLKIQQQTLLLIFLAVTALWATVSVSQLWPLIAALLSKKVSYFFAFFLFGMWLRGKGSKKLLSIVTTFKILPPALVMLCAVIYLVNIGPDKELFKGLAWLLMNLCLIAIAVSWIQSETKVKPPRGTRRVLVSMGRISLPIYLWHMLPMFFLKGFDIHESNTLIYYLVSIVTVSLITAILIKLEDKSDFLNKVIYGIPRKAAQT